MSITNQTVGDWQKPGKVDCMIDLETVDNSVTSAIASIGAVLFDKDGVSEDKFYCVVDTKSCIDFGMTVSEDTLNWWKKQSPEAQAIFLPQTPKATLPEALTAFSAWLKGKGGKYVWGNGADFDNAIMSYAYRICGLPQPWKFSDSRCFRTIKNGVYIASRAGVYHNAVDDAETQALYMIEHGLIPVR